jgi:hypothetical protein
MAIDPRIAFRLNIALNGSATYNDISSGVLGCAFGRTAVILVTKHAQLFVLSPGNTF